MSREVELLNALARGPGGIEIRVRLGYAEVVTQYAPIITGDGKDLFAAAMSAARQMINTSEPKPPAAVLKALAEYDNLITL